MHAQFTIHNSRCIHNVFTRRIQSKCRACMHVVCTYIPAELQHKYNMKRLHGSCSRFITNISLDIDNLPRWHILASKFGYKEALEHCNRFVGDGRFDTINR